MMRVLVADDEPMVLRVVIQALVEWFDAEVVAASGGVEALALLAQSSFDLVVVDMKMPRVNGVRVAEAARLADPPPQVVVMTGYADPKEEDAIFACGACLLRKPFDADELRRLVTEFAAG